MEILELGLKSANHKAKAPQESTAKFIDFKVAESQGYLFDETLTVRQPKKADGEPSKPCIAYTEPGETEISWASLSIALQEEGFKKGMRLDPKLHQVVLRIVTNETSKEEELLLSIGKRGDTIKIGKLK